MLTAQNKSIEGLTLTGSWYYAADDATDNDMNILWADAKFKVADLTVALQGGTIMDDDLVDDAVAFGAKVGGNFGMVNASLAYSSTDENAAFTNTGGPKTPLYTQMILNQGAIKSDADTIVARAGAKVLGGKLGVAYCLATSDSADDYTELDVTYKTKVLNDSTTVFAGYVYTDYDDAADVDGQNMIRVWGRYNF